MLFTSRNKWLIGFIVYSIIAFSFLLIANDNPILVLIKIPSFKTDVFFALLTTYFTGYYLSYISNRLDDIYRNGEIALRIRRQFIEGLMLPLLLVFILESIYLSYIHIPITTSSIWNLELPLVFLYLTIINGFYLVRYILNHKHDAEVVELNKENTTEFIIVQKGFVEEKIEISKCAFISSNNKLLWMTTLDGNEYRVEGTLKDWEPKLPSYFFKVNRQYIVSSKAIKSIELTSTRKLKINFIINQPKEIFVSKENATSFRKWWNEVSPH